MNKKNARLLIKDIENGTKARGVPVAFDMNYWDSGEEDGGCGTSCCIGGHAEIRIAKQLSKKGFSTYISFGEIREWLGVTHMQAATLFYPELLEERRRNGISRDRDIWGNIKNPLKLKGERGRKAAVRAIERAIKLWG